MTAPKVPNQYRVIMTDEQKAVARVAARLARLFYQAREDGWDDETLEAVAVDAAQEIIASTRSLKE